MSGDGPSSARASPAAMSPTVRGVPDPTRENTSPEGKASSVQFLKFPFSPGEIARFQSPGTAIVVGFDDPNYAHMAVMPEAVRAALAQDFD